MLLGRVFRRAQTGVGVVRPVSGNTNLLETFSKIVGNEGREEASPGGVELSTGLASGLGDGRVGWSRGYSGGPSGSSMMNSRGIAMAEPANEFNDTRGFHPPGEHHRFRTCDVHRFR